MQVIASVSETAGNTKLDRKMPVVLASLPRAPTRTDRPFHNIKPEYGQHSIDRAILEGRLIEEDGELISEFVAEIHAVEGISDSRVNKITYTLVTWRDYIGPFSQNTLGDLHRGISALRRGEKIQRQGKQIKIFKQNTQRDFISFIKRFYCWLIERGLSCIEEKDIERIAKIRAPSRDTMTKTSEQLITDEEIAAILRACRNAQESAFVSLLYEGGFRIEELGRLTWDQVQFDEYGVVINVNEKTGCPRFVRIIAYAEYLAQWKDHYPLRAVGNSLVFLSKNHLPIQYPAAAKMLRQVVKRAGITRKIQPHLFRHTRVTRMIQLGFSESLIKKMIWGNVNSTQFSTYLHLTNDDLDNEMLAKAGIREAKKPGTETLQPRQCDNCLTINPPISNYCNKCGEPLTEEAIQDHRALMAFIDEEVEKEKSAKSDVRKLYVTRQRA